MMKPFLFKSTELLISDVWMHLLAVQEVHDGLQDIVSLLDNAAIGWDGLSLDLGEDVSHLPDVVLDLGLEATSPHESSTLETDRETSLGTRVKRPYLTAKMWLRSSMTLLSLFCSSLRKSLASTCSWKPGMGNEPGTGAAHIHNNRCARTQTHVFASHGLKHLLQLDPELLDVIDDDTRLMGRGRKASRSALPGNFFSPSPVKVSPISTIRRWKTLLLMRGREEKIFSIITAHLGAPDLSGRAAHFAPSPHFI